MIFSSIFREVFYLGLNKEYSLPILTSYYISMNLFSLASIRASQLLLILALVLGVPLFLHTPPWCDLTLYQVAARNILAGGAHYTGVFDTNLPGFVWCLAALQAVTGPSVVAVRVLDLGIVAGITGLLLGLLRRSGASVAMQWSFAAAVALFYPFTTEFNHAQRDIWMLLPALAAFRLRLTRRAPFWEGVLWGLAVWVKPHVVVPALAVWLMSMVAARQRLWRETGWLLAGGIITGLVGLGAIFATGSWPGFVEVFTIWNPEYTAGTLQELPDRWSRTIDYFPPWSLLHVISLPLAVWQIARRFRQDSALLPVLYLGWMAQALFLQKGLDYIHVPEMFLALALLASRGIPVGFVGLGLLVAQWGFAQTAPPPNLRTWAFPADTPRVFDARTRALWPRCFVREASPELQDDLMQLPVHCVPTWADLNAVENFLRAVQPPLKDGELLAFHDSPHPLYLSLNVRPATRYMHFGTVLRIRSQQEKIASEIRAAKPRFVVSDLKRMTWYTERAEQPGSPYPAWFPASERDKFPWNQPVVFRSGRYLVHECTGDLGEIDIPAWEDLGSLP
jgi:hypothetical protein